VKAKR